MADISNDQSNASEGSLSQASKPRKRVDWRIWLIPSLTLLIGLTIGAAIDPAQLRSKIWALLSSNAGDSEILDEEEADASESAPIFDVSLAAQASIGLQIGQPTLGNYQELVSVPAVVRERPAVSNLQASSKLSGIVRKIFVHLGQSVREGDELIELELTDDRLAQSQAALLESSKQLEIVLAELARIAPIAEAGGVARKNYLEKDYDRRRLEALVETRQQELLVKGFSGEQIARIRQSGQLVRSMTIRVPEGIQPDSPLDSNRQTRSNAPSVRHVSFQTPDTWVYSIEELNVSPGSMVIAGQPLCDLAYHATLLLEGQAYEEDIPTLTNLLQNGQGVTISMGSDDDPLEIERVPILFMDNHVAEDSQTIRFFMELENAVTSETKSSDGSLFRSWLFRPSQRGHVLLPRNEWSDKILLPADAVAKDGLDSIAFRHLGKHYPDTEPAHSEFEKVVVQVLHEDRRMVVVETGGDLSANDEVALNAAYLLLLQMQKGSGGGGHHHHDH